LGGYTDSFSERQLKGEAKLEQPRGAREVNQTTVNAFLVFLLTFAGSLLLAAGWYIKANNIHTIFP
jgi:hypothetical protein